MTENNILPGSEKLQNEKVEAMKQLLAQLNEGIRSGEEEGWYSEEEVRRYLHEHRLH